MKYYIIGTIMILALIIIPIIQNKLNSKEKYDYKKYTKKKLLTETELFFYDCFKNIDPKYIVLPQITLSSIIKRTDYHKYQNELYRVLDFAIFDQNYNVLLAIEINDDSHNSQKRKYRDIKIKEILKSANIELLTYNVNYPNTKESVINRTIATLNKTKEL